jgi:predicted lipid-binding transport protein (Tim44 family)
MNRSFVLAVVAVLLTTLAAQGDADAKRLGGGKSLGTQRQSVAPPPSSGPAADPVMPAQPGAAAAKAAPTTAGPAAAAPASGASRWLGPIAGIAAGLGLAALLSHFGLPEGFASFLLLGLLVVGVVLVFRMMAARRATVLASSNRAGAATAAPVFDAAPARVEPRILPGAANVAKRLPPGFDAAAFLREATLQFRRLQAAWDVGDRKALADVMTSAMAAEIGHDLDERGAHQATDIVSLNAELLEVTTEAGAHWASVRFTGLMREGEASEATELDEVWNLSKPVDGSSGWLLAGIRQTA